jgi:hypothetical protein
MVDLQKVIQKLEGQVIQTRNDMTLENEALKKKLKSEKSKFDQAMRDKESECNRRFEERVREIQNELDNEREAFSKVVDELMQTKGSNEQLMREMGEKDKIIKRL